jgi:hypothetical protein
MRPHQYRPAPPTPPSTGRAVLIGVLVGLFILLLIAAAVIAYNLASQQNNASGRGGAGSVATGAQAPTPTRTSGPASGAKLVDVGCGKLRGKPYGTVLKSLTDSGFQVARIEAADAGKQVGDVVDLSPCQARPGDTITVAVSPGRTRPSAAPAAAATPGCGIDTPIVSCASGLPSGSVGPYGH